MYCFVISTFFPAHKSRGALPLTRVDVIGKRVQKGGMGFLGRKSGGSAQAETTQSADIGEELPSLLVRLSERRSRWDGCAAIFHPLYLLTLKLFGNVTKADVTSHSCPFVLLPCKTQARH